MKSWPAIFEKIRRTLMRRGGSAEEAEDLVQEAWLRLAGYEREVMPVRDPEQFLLRTAVNLAIDLRRLQTSHGEQVEVQEVVLVDAAPSPEAVVLGRERLDRACRCLGGMTERTRDIFLAHRLDGQTYQEIADQQGLSVSAVEKHIARAALGLTRGMRGW